LAQGSRQVKNSSPVKRPWWSVHLLHVAMARGSSELHLDSADGEERVNIVPGAVEHVSLPSEQDRPGTTTGAAASAGRLSWRGVSLISMAVLLGVAGCWVLAAFSAAAEAGEEDAAVPARALSPEEVEALVAEVATAGVGGAESQALVGGCRTALEGEPCHRHVTWAMQHGIRENKDWYPGLTEKSSFEDFQDFHHTDPYARCPLACRQLEAKEQGAMTVEANVTVSNSTLSSSTVFGYTPSGRVVSQGQWCSVNEPEQGWALRSCGSGSGITVKVLTYNLFWWNLFGRRHGNGGSAGRLIAEAGSSERFDVMGFQECEGVGWVLGDAGLATEYGAITGPHAMCMAYRKDSWTLLADGAKNVGEDRGDQWYGTRAVMWARLQHSTTGQVLFFVNHHGPLPVHSGGRCGGEATAYNILKLIANTAHADDAVVLVGDFNAGPNDVTLQSLNGRMHHIYTGSAFGGVDHVFSSCEHKVSTRNLGDGGSDHDALEAIIQL